MNDDGLPPLREVIERHGLNAKKSLGQNFLFDFNLTRRIARSALPLDNCTVVEIGPGPGGLTRALLMEGAKQVIAIERDDRTLPALAEIQAKYPRRLRVVNEDALKHDWSTLEPGPVKVVANLPYNISTALLTRWLAGEVWPPWFQSLTLMFQKEVALRITALPGSSDYGRLSVLCQWRCTAHRLFDVHRSAFTPPPKITSTVVQLSPRAEPYPPCSVHGLERLTAAAFGQRRKMLRSSLKAVFKDPVDTLQQLGIDPQKRAEELTVAQFGQLALMLDQSSVDSFRTNSVSPN